MNSQISVQEHDKQWAAASSLFAAVGLTSIKLIVGLLTGSLGILAEAAHSALDLAAAAMTFLAVRISGRPADRTHLYGHGKVENLSALFETLLLLVTCVWIIWEAVRRLMGIHANVEVTFWSYAVMVTSIVVDASRSRMLKRVADKYSSQALEADALHFQTDIWSSSVVILGLFAMQVSRWFPSLEFLHHADAVAALGVAVIVVWISVQLGMRTVHALVDAAPAGMQERIAAAVDTVPGVANCHNVRVRYSGAHAFVDLHVLLPGNQTLKEAHALADQIEQAVAAVVPGADVTVHPEPVEQDREPG